MPGLVGPRRGSERGYGSPRTVIEPLSGLTAPVRILTSVLLPAPLAPMSAWTSPGMDGQGRRPKGRDGAISLGNPGRLEQQGLASSAQL